MTTPYGIYFGKSATGNKPTPPLTGSNKKSILHLVFCTKSITKTPESERSAAW